MSALDIIFFIFDAGPDLQIRDSANRTSNYLNLGHSYHHPQPSQGKSFLAGSDEFKLSEIEVYSKRIKERFLTNSFVLNFKNSKNIINNQIM